MKNGSTVYAQVRDLIFDLIAQGPKTHNELEELTGLSESQVRLITRCWRTGPKRILRISGRRYDAESLGPAYEFEFAPGKKDARFNKLSPVARAKRYRERKKEKARHLQPFLIDFNQTLKELNGNQETNAHAAGLPGPQEGVPLETAGG